MRILLVYHFFQPDTVISARLFTELAEDLSAAGHQVTVFTSNRQIRKEGTLPPEEVWRGIEICRFARPGLRQGSNLGRLFNSFILQWKWRRAFSRRRADFDAVILGTDPQFSYLMLPSLRRMAPRARLIHWVFDLYPEALAATGSPLMRLAARIITPLARRAYRSVDVMADIGQCMRERLLPYRHSAEAATLPPWALAEPPAATPVPADTRRELFGDARLAFLYSGTVGHAHDLAPFIAFARECRRRGLDAAFCFAGYGNQFDAQTACLTPEDTNIRLAPFVPEEQLAARLAAADFHLISLRQGWQGIVVPSKFFGALAIGRPVLFSGPQSSCIAAWIRQYGLGEILAPETPRVMAALLDNPTRLAELRRRAWETYQAHFSRAVVTARFLELLAAAPP